ncbi:MAG: hypothetical protein ABIR26_07670 [Ramlibacter sp.]
MRVLFLDGWLNKAPILVVRRPGVMPARLRFVSVYFARESVCDYNR